MMRIRCGQLGRTWVGIGLLMALPAAALGQIIASDVPDPNDPAYIDGWDAGDNGGTGFLPWNEGLFYGNPVEIDAAPLEADNGLGGASAFRFGTGGFGYWAVRPFANTIAPAQTFKMDFDPFDFDGDGEFNSMLGFRTADGTERLSLYSYAFYDGGSLVFGSGTWGVGATSANNNLNGGMSLPNTGCLGSAFCTDYTMTDSSDGFSLTLDIVTIDTYRLRIEDDGATKLDISGQLAGPAGQGLKDFFIWSTDGTGEIHSTYFSNIQILVTPSDGVPGDYNDDGEVDAADYVVWRKNVGTMNMLPNDPDGGTIGSNQYNTWRANFGEMSGSGSGLGVVPEPSSVLLMLIGCFMAVRLRRSR